MINVDGVLLKSLILPDISKSVVNIELLCEIVNEKFQLLMDQNLTDRGRVGGGGGGWLVKPKS